MKVLLFFDVLLALLCLFVAALSYKDDDIPATFFSCMCLAYWVCLIWIRLQGGFDL